MKALFEVIKSLSKFYKITNDKDAFPYNNKKILQKESLEDILHDDYSLDRYLMVENLHKMGQFIKSGLRG